MKNQKKTQIERTRKLASLTKIDNLALDQVRGGQLGIGIGKVRTLVEVV